MITLEDDIIVIQRTSAGGATTPWFTTREYVRAGNARRYLALPNWNDGTQVTRYLIPKDTKVIIGKVASQTGDLLNYGPKAVGGGFQIYLPELVKAIKLP